MTKLTAEQLKEIKAAMLKKNFKYKQINGIHNFINGAIMEGIEVKTDCSINPYWTDIDSKRYGYEAVGNETRNAVSILEQILMEDATEGTQPLTKREAPKQEIETKEAELIPTDKLLEDNLPGLKTGIVPKYLTDAIIDKHPGTTSALISMQKTAEINIRERKGPKGTVLSYVDTAYMTTALNWATLMNWDFEVVETREDTIDKKRHISVLGCLTIHTTDGKIITKQQWGSQVLKAGMEMGDALKAAASDALKKCASMLGIAGDVYAGAV